MTRDLHIPTVTATICIITCYSKKARMIRHSGTFLRRLTLEYYTLERMLLLGSTASGTHVSHWWLQEEHTAIAPLHQQKSYVFW